MKPQPAKSKQTAPPPPAEPTEPTAPTPPAEPTEPTAPTPPAVPTAVQDDEPILRAKMAAGLSRKQAEQVLASQRAIDAAAR